MGKPSKNNPYPTTFIGYESSSKVKNIAVKRRSIEYRRENPTKTPKLSLKKYASITEIKNNLDSKDQLYMNTFFSIFTNITLLSNIISKSVFFFLQIICNNIQRCQTIRILNKKILSLQSESNHLKNQVHKCTCQVPIPKKLLINDSKTLFYTGLETYELFTKLHGFTTPFPLLIQYFLISVPYELLVAMTLFLFCMYFHNQTMF